MNGLNQLQKRELERIKMQKLIGLKNSVSIILAGVKNSKSKL
jgi:hypothetical protein